MSPTHSYITHPEYACETKTEKLWKKNLWMVVKENTWKWEYVEIKERMKEKVRKRERTRERRENKSEREREGQPVWVLCLLRRSSEIYRQRHTISSHRRAFTTKAAGARLAATSTTSESLESYALDAEIPAAARRPRSTRGSQKWSNVRAVMALYSSLRKIKRYSRH